MSYLNHLHVGEKRNIARKSATKSIKKDFLSMNLLFNIQLFDRRTEIVKFHPHEKFLLFVCSHGGDIAVIDNKKLFTFEVLQHDSRRLRIIYLSFL